MRLQAETQKVDNSQATFPVDAARRRALVLIVIEIAGANRRPSRPEAFRTTNERRST